MEQSRATWTDERLDDLARRVDDGFNRVDRRFESLEARLDRRFDALDARLDALQQTMIRLMGAMTIAVFATLLTVVLTQA
jgi:flagellar capping protein FliD